MAPQNNNTTKKNVNNRQQRTKNNINNHQQPTKTRTQPQPTSTPNTNSKRIQKTAPLKKVPPRMNLLGVVYSKPGENPVVPAFVAKLEMMIHYNKMQEDKAVRKRQEEERQAAIKKKEEERQKALEKENAEQMERVKERRKAREAKRNVMIRLRDEKIRKRKAALEARRL